MNSKEDGFVESPIRSLREPSWDSFLAPLNRENSPPRRIKQFAILTLRSS